VAAADPIAAVVAPEAAPAATAPPVPSDAAVAAARRTIGVQNALNQSGYGPVPNDGMLSDATVNAIRRFELDNGMAITGRISDPLIDKLIAIGAMNPA
jgi:peptidoglycan hydrolase-like protein with peptidoglycan-binding domain